MAGHAGEDEEAERLGKDLGPDLVIMDALPGANALMLTASS